jgi:glutathione S-transferase
MTLELSLGDRAYSSWSLRLALLVTRFELPVPLRVTPLYTPGFRQMLTEFAPARTVPALRLEDGTVIAESLAIAEELASRFPDAGLWPADPTARAVARALAAEMHAGFTDLRSACPMNLRAAYAETPVSDAVRADLARLETLWAWARATLRPGGPWLCGAYSIADAFFAPVAARIATYALPVEADAAAYVTAHLSDPAFVRWRATALTDGPDQPVYARDYPPAPWPSPA